jgi:molybdopterin converting factor small subunit
MKLTLLSACAILACGFVAATSYASEERREERRERREAEIDWEKEKIERAELREAIEKEHGVVAVEHKAVLEELRESLKEEKFDHVAALRRLHKEHRELVEHLLRHIREGRERRRERK